MSIYRPNPSQVTLQLSAHNIDGTPKLSLTSAKVRVYHMNGASEVEDLAEQNLLQVGSTNVWRYVWTPVALPVDVYYAAYALVDSDGAAFADFETIYVLDIAEGEKLEVLQGDMTGLMADVELIKQIETGRWRIDKVTDQMIFYDDTDTPILTFDLKDIDGLPNHVNIFERDPV
jgi:hypothetical protein